MLHNNTYHANVSLQYIQYTCVCARAAAKQTQVRVWDTLKMSCALSTSTSNGILIRLDRSVLKVVLVEHRTVTQTIEHTVYIIL